VPTHFFGWFNISIILKLGVHLKLLIFLNTISFLFSLLVTLYIERGKLLFHSLFFLFFFALLLVLLFVFVCFLLQTQQQKNVGGIMFSLNFWFVTVAWSHGVMLPFDFSHKNITSCPTYVFFTIMITARRKGKGCNAPLCFFFVTIVTTWRRRGAKCSHMFFLTIVVICRNPNIEFTTKCEVQRPLRSRVCLGVKRTLANGGIMQGMKPDDSQMHSHFGSYTKKHKGASHTPFFLL
jgi:hypothetical protein